METMFDMNEQEIAEMKEFTKEYISGKFDKEDEEGYSEFKELTGMSEKEYYLG